MSESIGPTDEETKLLEYLGDCLNKWVNLHGASRKELNFALFYLCRELFTEQTPLSIKQQCEEIDGFCYFLKKAAKSKKNNNEMVKSN